MNELALFAGAGGGLLATHHLLGWRCVGYVEMEKYPCEVLEARINDGLLSPAPIFQMHTSDFIRLGLAEKYRGVVDVITAGFPCQPFSQAGKRLAEQDDRNSWPDTIEIIRLVRPSYILLENVASLVSNPYFGTILGDLAASRYDCRWDCIPASAIGANHQRDRLWIAAWDTYCGNEPQRETVGENSHGETAHAGGSSDLPNADGDRFWQRTDQQIKPLWSERSSHLSTNGQGQTLAHPDGLSEVEPRNNHQTIISGGDTWLEFGGSGSGQPEPRAVDTVADTNGQCGQEQWWRFASEAPHLTRYDGWWEVEPGVGRVVNGLAHRVDRLKAIGGGQVPAVVREFWRVIINDL